ncbi:2-octaprenyl-6-methoxyphenol 4-monooxygenase [Synechococcus sp. KORDI-52]|uniref:FAD-dependent monooxygenase n=1 Tax=Synechococcus sp. KORDI-52 TaxID=585425 RepID=UPI0004E07E79|nr:FAD-dependent monooxygenase [Synechococcus sp. KORDI-52]AII48923.1 2-octaprenyl-6-methoxyphenol 4-monooxygenase [Synechococcus sp. KORDI-52]
MVPSLPEIHVLGAGPTGALTAFALAHHGQRVVLHDPLTASELQARSRAYAITHSSRRLLSNLGLWDDLREALVPFRDLDLRDAATNAQVMFGLDDLATANRNQDGIGWILDHRPLMQLLLARLEASSSVNLHLAAPCPEPGDGALIVAADGPRSPTREAWGIRYWGIRYRQGCLTAKVVLRGLPHDRACELFRPEGPFAVLPLGQGTFQVVWSAPWRRCQERSTLPRSAFLDQLAAVLPPGMEPDRLLDHPRAFPQQWLLAHSFHRGRGVLIGEAAHRCHPVGGQGLNLCWRDVEGLIRAVQRGGSATSIAQNYAKGRWLDVLQVGLATDLLVRLFSNRQPLLLPLRRMALHLLKRFSGLRRLSLRAMSDGPMQLWRALPN